MTDKSDENLHLREYLLCILEDEAERDEIEKRLFIDKQFYARVILEEDEIVQDYADGNMAAREKEAFEKNFLISADRRENLNFSRALRKYIDNQTAEDEASEKTKKKKEIKSTWSFLFSSPRLVAAAAGGCLLIILSAWAFYYIFSRPSDTELAAVLLNQVYQSERPFETRVTDFDYAPFRKERGDKKEPALLDERNRAERILLDRAAENQTAENLHALGRLYLVKKQFDESIDRLEKAALNSANPLVYNDLGAAYLEKSRVLSGTDQFQLQTEGLKNFKKALELNPRLPEAQFNKAVCLETLNLPGQAREAWQQYLEIDSSSPWSKEARQHLEELNPKQSSDVQSNELETAFLNFAEENRGEEAIMLAGENRELIKEKYLPQKLAMSAVEENSKKKV